MASLEFWDILTSTVTAKSQNRSVAVYLEFIHGVQRQTASYLKLVCNFIMWRVTVHNCFGTYYENRTPDFILRKQDSIRTSNLPLKRKINK